MPMTVLVFGEILWDELPDRRVLGGAPCNLGFRLHSLGHDTRIVSRIGNDALGREALAKLESLGMDTCLIQVDKVHPTGTVSVKLDEQGKPEYVIHPDVAYDFVEWTPAVEKAVKEAEVIAFGTLAQRSSMSAATLRKIFEANPGCLRFLDLNLRKDCYTEERILSSLEYSQVVKMNDEEARKLADLLGTSCKDYSELAREFISRFGLEECVITFGENGAYAVRSSGDAVYVKASSSIEVKDTIGAGDAFSACYLRGILQNSGLGERCILANRLAGKVAGQSGATESIDGKELEVLLSTELEIGQTMQNIPSELCVFA